MELDKERERKQILEEQSQLLQQKVAEQTADLRALIHLKDMHWYFIKFSFKNGIIKINVKQKGKGFVISVIDKGVGITEAQIQKIAT